MKTLICKNCGFSAGPNTLPPLHCMCGHTTSTKQDTPIQIVTPPTNPWTELHEYAPKQTIWNETEARVWYDNWLAKVPNKCGCQATFTPTQEFSSPEKFFEAAFRDHDTVTKKILKDPRNTKTTPLLTLEEAYKMYWDNK